MRIWTLALIGQPARPACGALAGAAFPDPTTKIVSTAVLTSVESRGRFRCMKP